MNYYMGLMGIVLTIQCAVGLSVADFSSHRHIELRFRGFGQGLHGFRIPGGFWTPVLSFRRFQCNGRSSVARG